MWNDLALPCWPPASIFWHCPPAHFLAQMPGSRGQGSQMLPLPLHPCTCQLWLFPRRPGEAVSSCRIESLNLNHHRRVSLGPTHQQPLSLHRVWPAMGNLRLSDWQVIWLGLRVGFLFWALLAAVCQVKSVLSLQSTLLEAEERK